MTKDIHRGGRPPINRPKEFYRSLLDQYQSMTINQLAAAHGCSRATISRWLKVAREEAGK